MFAGRESIGSSARTINAELAAAAARKCLLFMREETVPLGLSVNNAEANCSEILSPTAPHLF